VVAGFQVITVASPASIPPGSVIGTDTENDTPVVIAYAGKPPLTGAEVVSLADALPDEGGDGGLALTNHISDNTPHPAYDDMPSLTLLFNNGLV
jgi:hypothetical protein